MKATTADFLHAYYNASRYGGLGKSSVLEEYFTDSFEWYNEDDDDDDGPKPRVIDSEDRPKFRADHKKKGWPDKNGCWILDIKVTDAHKVGDEVVVNAIFPWGTSSNKPQGEIPALYTLAKSVSGQPYRIHKVRQLDPSQHPC